jgi:riboflavin kinase/FMN adenylyltransferase
VELRVESLTGRDPLEGLRAIAIGNFDGVHLGHARLLNTCVEAARQMKLIPTVLTFEPHPASVVSKEGAPPRIQTLSSRRRRLREIGIEDLAELRFDRALAALSPSAFVNQVLVAGARAGCVIVGEGFRFGAGRAGDVSTLASLGAGHFVVKSVATLEDAEGRISSSRIRSALLRGDLKDAERFLGRPYEVEGRVVHGDHRGRVIGFPTANVDLGGVGALKRGVYVADAQIDDENTLHRAAVNLGIRPTFGGSEPRLEAHLLGFDGDLYGRSLRLIFLGRLRDERKFESLEELKAQLQADVAAAARTP